MHIWHLFNIQGHDGGLFNVVIILLMSLWQIFWISLLTTASFAF
jgi:hypothetical protein